MLRAVILRLQTYLEYVTAIKSSGRTTVTSAELAIGVGLSSSRVRQDLIPMHVAGKPRAGYDLAELEILLYSELDVLTMKGMALVGCGNLGKALAQSGIWERAGFALKAVFDNDPSVVGSEINNLTVRHIHDLSDVVKSETIVAACLAVPAAAAQAVASALVSAGVRGIWNFTPVNLRVPPDLVIENQHLERNLTVLSCLLRPALQTPGCYAKNKDSEAL